MKKTFGMRSIRGYFISVGDGATFIPMKAAVGFEPKKP